VTRHPGTGAAEEPAVTAGELVEKKAAEGKIAAGRFARASARLAQVNLAGGPGKLGVPHVSFSETWDSTTAAILRL
jgi:hypothetical protein